MTASTNDETRSKAELIEELQALRVELARAQVPAPSGNGLDYRNLLENMPGAVLAVDDSQHVILANSLACNLFGYTREGLLHRHLDDLMPERYRGSHGRLYQSYVHEPTSRLMGQGRYLIGLRKDGTEFPIEIGLGFLEYDAKRLSIAFISDVTALRCLEEDYQRVLDNALQGFAIIQGSEVAYINPAFEHLLGYTLEELRKLTRAEAFSILIHSDDLQSAEQLVETLAGGKLRPSWQELQLVHKDGSIRRAQMSFMPTTYRGNFAMQLAVLDITEQKKAEAKLQRYQEHLEELVVQRTTDLEEANRRLQQIVHIVERSIEGFVVVDRAGQVRFANPAARALLGQYDEPLVGSSFGLPLAGDLTTTIDIAQGEKEPIVVEMTVVESEWEDAPVYLVSLRDVTEQHRADDQLRRANMRLQALSELKDEFVTNVSHELRTPIASIKLHHHLLSLEPQRLEEYTARLKRETRRLESIIEDLLKLSQLEQNQMPLQFEMININDLVAQYHTDRLPLAREQGLALEVQLESDLPPVKADTNHLGQALSTLLTNALNYTPSGETVTIKTARLTEDAADWLTVQIIDTGPGIPLDEQARIFERFYRGKEGRRSGKPGTGLGLSIAQDIIKQHGGRLEVYSDGVPGKGTTFTVRLPVGSELQSD